MNGVAVSYPKSGRGTKALLWEVLVVGGGWWEGGGSVMSPQRKKMYNHEMSNGIIIYLFILTLLKKWYMNITWAPFALSFKTLENKLYLILQVVLYFDLPCRAHYIYRPKHLIRDLLSNLSFKSGRENCEENLKPDEVTCIRQRVVFTVWITTKLFFYSTK